MNESVNLEDKVSGWLQSSVSGTGEEELLRIASNYSRQITARQIRALVYLELIAEVSDDLTKRLINRFIEKWLELKRYNNSDIFVMKALEFISLRKFINENTMKLNINKS